jgi:ribosome-binding protein aMBF1 (putative translation factor)
MSNRESSHKTRLALDKKLQALCAGAAPDDVIDDEFVDALMDWLGPVDPLSSEAAHYAVTQLQAAMKEDVAVASIQRARARATDEKTFGQILNEVRASAGWTLAAVAQRISSDTALVDRLERDLVPVEQSAARQWADLLEILHVRLADFTRLATRTLLMQRLQKTMGSVHARSSTNPHSAQHARDLAFAIANIIPDLDDSWKSPPALDHRLLDDLTAELRARHRTDLLS